MRYRRRFAVACLPVALAIGAAGCGETPSNSPSGPTTTEHDMSKMKPGDTMPSTTEHDMSKMKPGETMP